MPPPAPRSPRRSSTSANWQRPSSTPGTAGRGPSGPRNPPGPNPRPSKPEPYSREHSWAIARLAEAFAARWAPILDWAEEEERREREIAEPRARRHYGADQARGGRVRGG